MVIKMLNILYTKEGKVFTIDRFILLHNPIRLLDNVKPLTLINRNNDNINKKNNIIIILLIIYTTIILESINYY